MTYKDYINSLSNNNPPEGINDLLTSLWYAAKDDWETAHGIAQDIPGKDGAWIHAYLHRVEGDIGNANYWYSVAGKTFPPGTIEEEWKDLVMEFLNAAR